MTCSTFVWIDPQTVKTCKNLGFVVQTGRGENRFYIKGIDNPFNPSADIHRIPQYVVNEVTVRAIIKSNIPFGRYAIAKSEMRVSEHMVSERYSQGFFTLERKVASKEFQVIDLRAPTLMHALRLLQLAEGGNLKPDPVYTNEVMAKLD